MTAAGVTSTPLLRRVAPAELAPLLDRLSEWLLPGAGYGVHHTWPQLYRSDGDGRFFGRFDGDRLRSWCAFRFADAITADGPRRVALLGSVATEPEVRGRGLAQQVLQAALDDCRAEGAAAVLLWAERPELYARTGFAPGASELCLALRGDVGAPAGPDAVVETEAGRARFAAIQDHPRLSALHRQKPVRIDRTDQEMSARLTTPGLWTCVLERDGAVVAYACTGKGADLQGWWHELGGSDRDVTALLPAAARLTGLRDSLVLVPPYRGALPALLGDRVLDRATVQGPMVRVLGDAPLPALFVDGLDSV
ncbi:MAG: GNAT family N-acetyltransferase [Planctomycetota bacterium]